MHHEREDGKGYPFGVIGNKIHLYTKIISIADVYDAMTSDRVYKRRLHLLIPSESFKRLV